jgi:ADP-ribosylglycohydrolase
LIQPKDRFTGCLLAGAVGDALGAPVEFRRRDEILARFGPTGITRYAPAFDGLGCITDDTQMTLFTAEGLLRAVVGERVHGRAAWGAIGARALLRWLRTQGIEPAVEADTGEPGWLVGHPELHARRAPGKTCITALLDTRFPGQHPRNDSKGCGTVMRIAPVGLLGARLGDRQTLGETFDLAVELSALTHGHPTGQLAAAAMAVVIRRLAEGATLPSALVDAKRALASRPGHGETLRAIERAERLAREVRPDADAIADLGEGWVAEEALAIAVYCALVADDLEHGLVLAVNHDGDSDSTGAIAGHLLGALHGARAIPEHFLAPLELRAVIEALAADLHDLPGSPIGGEDEDAARRERRLGRYPPN